MDFFAALSNLYFIASTADAESAATTPVDASVTGSGDGVGCMIA